MRFVSGLDLGQQKDYSTLVVVQQSAQPDPDIKGATVNHYAVRHIKRWELGTKYPDIVDDLKELYRTGELAMTTLVVDRTGVGRGVCDMVEASGITANVQGYSITAGSKEGDHTVPKIDLVGAVQSTLQSRRLKFADLELTPILEKELEHFRTKVTTDRNETFGAWRESDHDDLVLALALAVWYGERSWGGGTVQLPPKTQLLPAYFRGGIGSATGWG